MAKAPDHPGVSPFVREIVADPSNVPEVTLIYGYLGASSEADHERLYLRADLAHYVEIPTSAILRRMAAPADLDPRGGTTLWVKKDAKLLYKALPGAQSLAQFFTGQIQTGAAAGGMPQPPPGLGAQGPVALGNSHFIKSCLQCHSQSFLWNCTM